MSGEKIKSKLTVAVCDDEQNALDIVSASVVKLFEAHGVYTELHAFSDWQKLWKYLQTNQCRLLFLDINLKSVDGIALGAKIKELKDNFDIVFVSSKSDRVFDSFAVNPFGFVRKDSFLADLSSLVDRYVEQKINCETDIVNFVLKEGSGLLSVDSNKIKYVECLRNAQEFHMSSSDKAGETHTIYSRMDFIETQLSPKGFLRVNNSFIVNYSFIKRFDYSTVTLTTGETLPVGRTYQKKSKDEYLEIIGTKGITIIG